ncbi:hypothetical protein BMAJHU_I0935 [Burkholderia mallei JHU]|nr:hypothetical protein BMAJHU_I0935 [Burkholderia mallei JHU]
MRVKGRRTAKREARRILKGPDHSTMMLASRRSGRKARRPVP